MKKGFCVLVVVLAIMLALGGCKAAVAPESGGTLPPASASPEAPTPPAPSVYVESTLENFHIALASDELLNKYDAFHEYIHEDGARVIIWTDTEVKNFAFISVDYDIADDQISFFAGDVLFSVDELSPEKPFVVETMAPEVLPLYGISFLDENNVQRYFSINFSGRGIEEAPPYFFLEFENTNSK